MRTETINITHYVIIAVMKKSKDIFSEVIVGIFMVAVLALLVYFTIIISGVDLVFGTQRVPVTIEFSDVGGLKERDSVVYRGMKVGAIENIKLSATNVLVEISVTRDVVLRDSYRISVAALSLLGGNYLLLEEGNGAVRPLTMETFKGEAPVDWMRDLGEIARNLNSITSGGGLKNLITNLETTAQNLNTIIARVERGEGTVGKLLSDDETLYNNISDTVASAKNISSRLEKGEGTIGRLLSTNDTVYVDLQRTLANASKISESIANGEGTLGKLISKDDAIYNDLKASIENIKAVTGKLKTGEGLLGRIVNDTVLADNADKLIANLTDVSERLKKGEGSIGKAMTDSELYDEMNALIKDIRQVVDNYRDTTPISTFGSLIMGGL